MYNQYFFVEFNDSFGYFFQIEIFLDVKFDLYNVFLLNFVPNLVFYTI